MIRVFLYFLGTNAFTLIVVCLHKGLLFVCCTRGCFAFAALGIVVHLLHYGLLFLCFTRDCYSFAALGIVVPLLH